MPDDTLRIPQHIAIIMDGNGRWAAARGLPRAAGHKAGIEAVRRAVQAVIEANIPYLTLFGFSSENWNRPKEEVQDLMGLLRFYLKGELAQMHKEGIRLRFIGDLGRLEKDLARLLTEAEKLTENNTHLNLSVALSYGGRQEIARAAQKLAEQCRTGKLDPSAIDEQRMGRELYTDGVPDPDLILRTSGEKRISNFLLWQSAYAEFVFLDTLWPDFSAVDLHQALDEFNRRERRYGARVG